MRPIAKLIALVALGVALAVPATSLARQPLSGKGKRAFLHAIFANSMPTACYVDLNAYRSTVNRQWGMFTNNLHFEPTKCYPYIGGGIVIVHHTNGKWHVVFEGPNDVPCPQVPQFRHVPSRVARDLARCH